MDYMLGLSAEPINNTISPLLKGVGMIRSEYPCRLIEEHIALPSCRAYVADYVSNICKIFYPMEVWYRTTEFITPEVNVLMGADDEIVEEKNYMLGLRGVRRGLRYKETFRLELENISNIAKEYDNLHVLFPYIKDPEELEVCIELLEKAGYPNRYGIMAEIPSSIFLLDEFIDLEISNITIGVNDLTMLTLGAYRGSDYHDPTHPAIVKIIKEVLSKGKKKGIPVTVAGIVNKKLCDICENIGVDRVVVNYDLLPDVLGLSEDCLEHINQVSKIKEKAKAKRTLMEENKWREKLGL